MKLELDTTELKATLSKYSLVDLILYMSWVFMHLGFFSHMNANDFFIGAGLVNFLCALGYKMIFKMIKWKI